MQFHALEVVAADWSEAQVRNLGEKTYGNVSVTWNHFSGGTVTKEFHAPKPGKITTTKAGIQDL